MNYTNRMKIFKMKTDIYYLLNLNLIQFLGVISKNSSSLGPKVTVS